MKLNLFSLFMFVSIVVFGQNKQIGKVEYLEIVNLHGVEFNFEEWKTNIHSLYFTPEESIYLYDKDAVKKVRIGPPIVAGRMNKTGSIDRRFVFYTNSKTDTVISAEYRFKGPYLSKEKKAKINWTITDKSKQIANYNCLQATCKFRGRYYTAWFTPEIPISAGPWKLQGLPGLILEATDKTKEVQYLFTSIAYPYKSKQPIEIKAPTKNRNKKIMTLLELADFLQEENIKRQQRMVAGVPQSMLEEMGIKIDGSQFNRIELEFEEGVK